MHRYLLALLAAAAVLVGGCGAGGTPKAVTPETRHDFGDVPVTADMNKAQFKRFVIKNEGAGDLKLGTPQVRLLDGC